MKKSPLNHCDSEMMHSGGWGQVRKYNSPGTTGNKEALMHNKKVMNKIGTFNMPHSPLNNNDSIAAGSAWKNFKKGYTDRKFKGNNEKLGPITSEQNIAEYNREKHEFYYDPKTSDFKMIPTDDGEREIKGFREDKEKWQFAPDRKSSTPLDCWKGYERVPGTKEFSDGSCRKKGSPANQNYFGGTPDNTDKQAAYEKAQDQLFAEGKITETDDKAVKLIEKRVKKNAVKTTERVVNMTPNVSKEQAKAVRAKFDSTYLKSNKQ